MQYLRMKQGIEIQIHIITSTKGCLLDVLTIQIDQVKKNGLFL